MSFPTVQVVEQERSDEGLIGRLTETNSILFSIIEKKPDIQLKEIISLIENVSQKTIERQIAQLVEKELIERRGSRKTGGYFVIND